MAADPRHRAETEAIAQALGARIRLGTSSWSFPGWRGIVWPDEPGWTEARCARDGLAIYAGDSLLRTVSIDRGYHAPLSADDLARYRAQLLDAAIDATAIPFRATSKVWSAITAIRGLRTSRNDGSSPASRFLSVDALVEEVVAPFCATFAEFTGPFVLEFPAGERHDEGRFASALDRFLRNAVRRIAPFEVVVEIRDHRLLGPRYAKVLATHGVAPCFTFHPSMPSLAAQQAWAARHGLLEKGGPPIVVRLMLPPGASYEPRRRALAPFDRLVDPQPRMRAEATALILAGVALERDVYVAVNNKAEGSAPLTVRALAEGLATALEAR